MERTSYYRLHINGREHGKLLQEKAFTSDSNNCLYLEIANKRPILHFALDDIGSRILFGDQVGHLYLIDLESSTFRLVKRLGSCITAISFVHYPNDCAINLVVCCAQYQAIYFLRLENDNCSEIASFTHAHQVAVNSISVNNNLLLTSSTFDCTILWDLDRLTIVKKLEDERLIKSLFLNEQLIVTSYRNHKIYIFAYPEFELFEIVEDSHLLSVEDEKLVARDETTGTLNLIQLDIAQQEQKLTNIRSSRDIKKLSPFAFDNKKLIALTEQNQLILIDQDSRSKLCPSLKFDNFQISDYILIALSCTGQLAVFDLRSSLKDREIEKNSGRLKNILLTKSNELKVKELADKILSKYQKFPRKYRFYIWSKIAHLPLNRSNYNQLKVMAEDLERSPAFKAELDLCEEKYKVADIKLKFALRKTISQLCAWDSSLIKQVSGWLPLITFPFVKLMPRNGLFRFELVACLLMNGLMKWSQERMQKARDILATETPKLIDFYSKKIISFDIYFKGLVESLFSDVFLREDWLVIVDHIVCLGIDFVDSFALAFNCVCRAQIMKYSTAHEVTRFICEQNAVPLDPVLEKGRKILSRHYSTKCIALSELASKSDDIYTNRSFI